MDLGREVNELGLFLAHAETHETVHARRNIDGTNAKGLSGPLRLSDGLLDARRELLLVDEREKSGLVTKFDFGKLVFGE